MNSDKINYIDDKEEKDFEAWKKDKIFYPWQNPVDKYAEYQNSKAMEERLEKEGVKQKSRCPECGIEEYIYPETIVLPEHEYRPYYCLDCQVKQREEEERKEDLKKEEEKKKKIDSRKMDFLSLVPYRYHDVRHSEETNVDDMETICSIYYGGFGTGKTWKAYKTAYDMYTSLKIDTFKVVTEIGLMNEIKAGFVDNSFDRRVKEFKEVELLIVDEMGKNNDSDFNKAQIFEILNYRYDWEKKTILICNCEEKKELYDILSPAILDRFRERIVKMDGKSKRYEK